MARGGRSGVGGMIKAPSPRSVSIGRGRGKGLTFNVKGSTKSGLANRMRAKANTVHFPNQSR